MVITACGGTVMTVPPHAVITLKQILCFVVETFGTPNVDNNIVEFL